MVLADGGSPAPEAPASRQEFRHPLRDRETPSNLLVSHDFPAHSFDNTISTILQIGKVLASTQVDGFAAYRDFGHSFRIAENPSVGGTVVRS